MRLFELPLEYWRPRLCEITTYIGMSIILDVTTRNMAFGHYARILVDIDLSKPLHSDILVERNEFAFYARVEYEKLTHLYDFCKTVDHTLPQCKKKKKKRNLSPTKMENLLLFICLQVPRLQKRNPVPRKTWLSRLPPRPKRIKTLLRNSLQLLSQESNPFSTM